MAGHLSLAQEIDRATKAVTPPKPARVPDWSEETMLLFAKLRPVEQAFVEWMAAGYSAAESFRRAAGLDVTADYARQCGHRLRHSKHVAAALAGAMRDRNFGARVDREWLFAKLVNQIEECEESAEPRLRGMLPQLLTLAARLKGEIVEQHQHKVEDAREQSHVSQRIDRLIETAERALGIRQVRDAEVVRVPAEGPARPALDS